MTAAFDMCLVHAEKGGCVVLWLHPLIAVVAIAFILAVRP